MGTYVNQVTGTTSDTGSYLDQGWNNLSAKADEAFSAAMNLAQSTISLNAIPLTIPASPNIAPGVSVDTSGAPVAPSLPSLVLSFPAAPTFTDVSIAASTAPSFSGSEPLLSYLSRPTVTQPVDPGVAPAITSPTLPADPNVVLPSVPTLRDISLPVVPSILIPVFAGDSPSDEVPELVQPNFIWAEAEYSPQLTNLATKISQYLMFDYDAAETAIWERGQERVERSTNEAVLQLTNDFASRGFALPSGVMLAAANEMRMKGAEAKYDNARDAMIKTAELNTQKLTLAIQSGIQYESAWMNYQTQYAQRAFDAAKVMVDVTLKLFDAKVALFNARLQAYQTEAQVHKDLIQAQLLTLETYKAQLEGQKLISTLNAQDVEIYKAQLQGTLTEVELYKSQISAVVALLEVDKTRMTAYATEVQAYKAKIDANTAEYSAWGESMRAEAVKAQVYETEVRAFASMVDAYKSTEGVKIDAAKLQIEKNSQVVDVFKAELSKVDSYVKQYAAEIEAIARVYGTESQVYGSVIGAREAEARTKLGVGGLQVDDYKARALISIEEAKTKIAELQVAIQAYTSRNSTAGSILSQLAASSMSAFNLSAGTSESFSLGVSNSLGETHAFTG